MSATAVVKHRKYPERKVSTLQRLTQLAEGYSIIAIAKLTKMRSQQVNVLRKKLRGKVVMLAVKNRVAALAFPRFRKPGVEKMVDLLQMQNLLLFTNLDPFELASILEKEKVELPARAGDVASQEILVPAGNTGIPPGPVLSDFKEAGVQTKIEGGSIWITKGTVVAKPGDVINPKLAGLLGRLGLKPVKAGLLIDTVYWNGRVVPGLVLKVPVEEVVGSIILAFQRALTISVETGYPTPRSVEVMLARATRQALALAVEAGYITHETAEKVIAASYRKALGLKRAVEQHGYSESSKSSSS